MRPVATRQPHVALLDVTARQLRIRVRTHLAVGFFGGVPHARGFPVEIAATPAEHLLEAPVAARDHPIFKEYHAHGQRVEHQVFLGEQGLVGGVRALDLGHVIERDHRAAQCGARGQALHPAPVAQLELA